MRFPHMLRVSLLLVLILALLAGCGPTGAAETTETEVAEPVEGIEAASLDELIGAVAPGAVIDLAEGEFTLTPPKGGGDVNEYCRWVDTYDGYGLEIHDVENLTIRGAGEGKTVISATPRYANVLTFRNCRNVTVADLTAGHTVEPGECSGGVLSFESCPGVTVESCGLYGCGTVGVQCQDCSEVSVKDTSIYECSFNAVSLYASRSVRVENCEVYRCGGRGGWAASSLFEILGSEDVDVLGCRVYDNQANSLIAASQSPRVRFLSNEVRDNRFEGVMFDLQRNAVSVDGCALSANNFSAWTGTLRPLDAKGEALSFEALDAMTLAEIDPASVVFPAPPTMTEVEPGGEVRVQTPDELLAAIGPDRTIVLAPGVFDLSEAADYGGAGGPYYYWESTYDGPELVISGVTGLTIRAELGDAPETVISARPRYADVLTFRDCGDLTLENFTAGHTVEPGECSGGVLFLDNCSSVTLRRCRLYGCGIMGIQAVGVLDLSAENCEIYECSFGAVSLYNVSGARFTDCDIHDVPSPAIYIEICSGVEWNGALAPEGRYDVVGGALRPFSYEPEPDYGLNASPFREGSTELSFALRVQSAFADGNWEAFTDLAGFPLRIYTPGGNYIFEKKEDVSPAKLDELFDGGFRRDVACAPLDKYVTTSFGSLFAEGRLAFERYASGEREELRVTAVFTSAPQA